MKAMSNAFARRLGVAAAALGVAFAVSPARAADDGQASLLSGLASTFGLTHDKDPQIDYRERSKIVLPPKMTLPPPGRSAGGQDASWPTDVETVRDQNEKKMEDNEPSARDRASGDWLLVQPGQDVKVTSSGFDGSNASCNNPDPRTGECPKSAHASINWNPLTWVGLEKKPATVLGPEPSRDSLIDPPQGYRAPAEGVGVKVQN